jgi:DNA-directed RNA polymerase specialized sigma24 family protein
VFPLTSGSVIERVRSGDADVRRVAFDDLVTGYWRPSYHYLRLQWRLAPNDAEDAVQGFFTAAFEKEYLEKYDASKARFRTFLRTCLDRFVQNTQKAERASKRGGGVTILPLDFPGAERDLASLPAAVSDVERFFHDETVRALFQRAVESTRAALSAEGKPMVFEVFRRHDLEPSSDTTYATIAADLHITVAQVTNHLHTARRQFRDAALAHLRAIAGTEQEYREDARALFGAEIDL